MNDLSHLLFLPIDISLPAEVDIESLDRIDYSDMYFDEYRNCYHINLYTAKLKKTKWLQQIPNLAHWLETVAFPLFPGRVMIIVTPPGESNRTHIDCAPNKMLTLQHKFRFVLQGEVSSLEFVMRDRTLRPPSDNPKSTFMMAGHWPHRMHNSDNKRKYTLGIGYPWEPSFSDPAYRKFISPFQLKYSAFSQYLNSEDRLPQDWNQLFDKKFLGEPTPDWHLSI